MPQQTNLNVSPYFDDFNSDNNYSKVLFKPGYPVQARELTTLQSILQNQIEKFGQHFFKEGAKVIPGNTGYNAQYYAVELNNSYLGVPVEAYVSQLIGTTITGQTSGVTAVVENVLFSANSERGNLTLYVQYISSSTTNNSTKTFSDGEGLLAGSTINSGLLGNSTIQAGQTFAITLANNATSIGSAFTITEGVYFVRGQFVRVATETIILDQYNNTSNYRVGLFVNEEIITSDIDEGLNDNSQGFNNYSAPGADRFKISVSLFKKSLEDFNDNNFVELASVSAGVLKSQKTTTSYSNLKDELARRTYSESGDYYVTPFDVSIKESLDNKLGNNGIFDSGQFTYSGSVPTDDLAVYQISPGKAFVRGYEIETISPTFIDVPKPRTTKTLENQAINYNTGPTLILNRIYGSPTIGIGNTYILSLRSDRVGISQTTAPGKEIGLSRVYDFRLESGSYNASNSNINQWYISLYDIQTITEISLNETITLSVPTFIKGNKSGATAFLKEPVSNSTLLTVYEKKGEFITNESFTIDGIANGRVATAITSYGISDVKSVYGVVGSGSTFTADVLQSTALFVGLATISPLLYDSNVNILGTNITSTVGVGSTNIFVNSTSGVSVGSSISIGTSITNAVVTGVGNTFVTIGAGATIGNLLNLTINNPVGFGSTQLFVTSSTGVSIGGSFNLDRGNLITTITTGQTVGIGSTQIFVTSLSGVSIGNSVTVGAALTNAPIVGLGTTSVFIGTASTASVTITAGTAVTFSLINFGLSVVSLGSTSIFIGAGNTISSTIGIGSTLAFTNVSSLITGSTVTFSNQLFTSNVISPNKLFPGTIVKKDNIVSYGSASNRDPFYGKVVSVGTTSIKIGGTKLPNTVLGITTVVGVCDGALPTATLSVSDLQILTTNLENSTDNTLYTILPKKNISSVDLTNASLTIRKSYPVVISNNQLTTQVNSGTNQIFLPFDEERYSLIRSDGSTEILTSDKFSFANGSTELQIYNLGSGTNVSATLVTTLTKSKPKAKSKLKNRVSSIIVNKSKYSYSGIGGTTINDGLTYGRYPYGTRVQDENICLNVPDIVQIHSIYESLNTSDPSAPTAVLFSITSPSTTTSELIIGEKIIGQTSGSIAICAEKLTNTQISFIYKNQNSFKEGETLVFQESNISAVAITLDFDSFNISSNYTFSSGQESTFYDFGTINRKSDSDEPTKKLKIYFQNGYYQSTDDGDITTVNSYNTFDYTKEIQNINGISNSDIIDIRPRVSSYTVSENSPSPLEFYGRTFSASGNSATNILASDESILTNFSFYLGRIDRIYLSKEGNFQIAYGTPSESPEIPVFIDGALEIATAILPPYLYSVSDISMKFLDYERYQMSDIKKLEDRIKSLEYYTSLSLLETNTAGLFVSDSNGLNRFKSGFFVDNFTSFLTQENSIGYKNSIDVANKEIRPGHYTTAINLIGGPVINVDPNADLRFSPPEGVNIRKSSDIITLDYAEREWFKQSFATRSESVTPFLISFWQGSVDLSPESDTWVDPVRLAVKTINMEGDYATQMALQSKTLGVDPKTGLAPAIWGSWQETWSGTKDFTLTPKDRKEINEVAGTGRWGQRGISGNGGMTGGEWTVDIKTDVYQDQLKQNFELGTKSRTGTQMTVTEVFDRTTLGDKVVSRTLIANMRSRNIEFIAKKIKPLTQLYAFFDGKDVTKYCVPKLIEITMTSGTFQSGETVEGSMPISGTGANPSTTSSKITFRVAQPNHKEGPYNAAITTFGLNPYTSQVLPATYSSTSTILNVDTYSLANEPQGTFSGMIESGMILKGKTSGGQATITNVRLISDVSATLIGDFYIPDPNGTIHPKFETGTKVFTLVDNLANNKNSTSTIAEERFVSSGTLETVQESIISVRNAKIENKPVKEDNVATTRNVGPVEIIKGTTIVSTGTAPQTTIQWYDPLAQSFLVQDDTGVFLTRCEVFFRSKDDTNSPVTFQIRTMQGGVPTQKVLPFSEIILEPSQVSTSGDGSVATSFVFKAPVYLEGGQEYCVCLASISTKYSVYICRIGENDLLTQTFISNQPTLGSLFKSQNASTWEPSQWEDLKFTLYRADFIGAGSAEFYSPELAEGNKHIATLLPDSLNLNSRKIRVGLGTTVQDSGLTLGNTVLQQGTNATGNFVGSAGISTGTLSVINAGIGYTPSSGSVTYSSVILNTITGNGQGATADITISNGEVVSTGVTIASGGFGYQVGDVVGITTIGSLTIGRNARFSVGNITGVNQLILDNVQGDFIVGSGKTVQYINNSGLTTTLNSSYGGNVLISNINTVSDGLSIVVNHKNHGMYSNTNLVSISGAISDVRPTKLTSGYDSNSTSTILVADSSAFSTFENVGVGTTNAGYLLIGNEIISYTSTSSGSIGGQIVRGSNPINYATGTPVYKYELGGVSLRRINKTHNLSDVTTPDSITFDSYTVKLDTSSNTGTARSTSSGYPTLYLNQTKSAGGYSIKASENIPFEIIKPMVHNVTVTGTSLRAELRTISASSISGNESSFINKGFNDITLNQINYFDSPRMIASKVNETQYLSTLPGNKSINLRLLLSTGDSRLTPVIDTQRISAELTSNRVNRVITNYAEDPRVNSIPDDPTAFQYLSKEITLENPGTSIKILLSAYNNLYSDIRVFYAISQNQNFNPIFEPFPGYENLDSRGQIINVQDNNGHPDVFVPPESSTGFSPATVPFKEYTFTADQLPAFRSYRIKIIMTSTNQVYVPRLKDLRVIALA
jgi:hypothetical protein